MKFGLTIAALAATLVASGAEAADWDSVGGWDVYEVDPARCVVGRVFAPSSATFGIILNVDGEVRLFATAAGWTARGGQKVDAAVGLDGQTLVAGASVGIEQGAHRGFVAAADDAFLLRFASANQLNLRAAANVPETRLPLTGASAGLAQGRRCLASLRANRSAGVPNAPRIATTPTSALTTVSTQPVGVATRPAVVRGSKANWIEAGDYPDAALRGEQQGSVTVRLAINSGGTVARCEVAQSSGSTALDATTCRMIQRRARYTPATDAAGRAVDGADQHTVKWALPQ